MLRASMIKNTTMFFKKKWARNKKKNWSNFMHTILKFAENINILPECSPIIR